MTDKDIVFAIKHLLPEAEFSFTDNDLDTIIWTVPTTGHPTKEEIIAAIEPAKTALEQEQLTKQTAKEAVEAKLAALGLTADDLKALGLGNN